MIYRMHPSVYEFQKFLLDGDTIEEAMGEECWIHFDARPTRYADNWVSIELAFYDAITESEHTTKLIPDLISNSIGQMFVSEKAQHLLAPVLGECGEWLPITYLGKKGYLLNVLNLAEDYDAIDKTQIQRDHDGLIKVAFDEAKLGEYVIFRTEEDCYRGIYCSDAVKAIIDKHKLQGCTLTAGLAELAHGTGQICVKMDAA